MIESLIVILVVCFLLFSLLELARGFAGREILRHSAARAARANEPTISVYSNYDALFKKPPPEEKPTVVVNKQINISNSTVVIN